MLSLTRVKWAEKVYITSCKDGDEIHDQSFPLWKYNKISHHDQFTQI